MQATADSRIIKRISALARGRKINQELLTSWLPKSVRRRCPAIILAASRTDRVIGRMRFLIISITTINGIRTGGVPVGTKWARNSVRLLISLNKIKASHRGSAKDNVIAKCLVAVKVNDASPNVLLARIKKNSLIKMIMLAFFALRSTENSFTMVFKIEENNNILGE